MAERLATDVGNTFAGIRIFDGKKGTLYVAQTRQRGPPWQWLRAGLRQERCDLGAATRLSTGVEVATNASVVGGVCEAWPVRLHERASDCTR